MEQVVGCEEHKAMAREISEKGITLVKYKDEDVLPMIPSRYKRIMIVSVSGLSAGVMGTMMAKYMGGGKKSPACLLYTSGYLASLIFQPKMKK